MESWRKPAVAVSISTRTAVPAGPDGVIGVDVVDGGEEQARQPSSRLAMRTGARLHARMLKLYAQAAATGDVAAGIRA